MVWVVLIVISTVISAAILIVIGGIGGMALLLALNGFSESQATPIIGCYALFVLGLDLIPVILLDWWVVRRWFPQAGIPFWSIIALNILVIVGLIGVVVGLVMVRRALS